MKKQMKTLLKTSLAACLGLSVILPAMAADDDDAPFKLDFYLDSYYAWDTDSHMMDGEGAAATLVERKERGLNAVGYRRNEFNLNTAQMTVSTDKDWYRGAATFQMGNIAQSSWALPYLNVQEAHLGFKPFSDLGMEGNDLWVDGGIFLTHIGNELLLPRYNWLSTLALVTMFEPFYQAGVKVGYNWGDTLSAELHIMNGYGIIDDNNASKTVGWLIGYSPMDNLSISYAATLGDEGDTGSPATRFYNNFNLNYQILDQFGIRGQVDEATQSGNAHIYYGAQLSARYDFMPNFGATVRGEVIQDPGSMLTDALQGFGVTLGLEYKPTDNSFVRLEGRQLIMDPNANKMFMDANGNASSNRTEVLVNTGVWF